MKFTELKSGSRLEDLPNVGRSIANDLRTVGINSPAELRNRAPLAVFQALAATMGRRHDPCVLYTLLAVKHFFESSESLPWWRFTAEGKAQLDQLRTAGVTPPVPAGGRAPRR